MVAPLELLLEHACALCRSLARVQARLTSCTGVGALRKALAGARAQVAGAVGKRRRAFTSVQACTPAPARACLRAGHRLRRGVQQERVTTTPLRVQAVQSAEVRRLGPCAHSCAFVRRVSRSSLVLCCRPLPQRPVSLPTPQQKLQQAGGQVVQLYRYPGLSSSKAKTLLRKAHDKVSPKLVAIDGELVRRHALHTSNWRSAQGALLTCSRAPPPLAARAVCQRVQHRAAHRRGGRHAGLAAARDVRARDADACHQVWGAGADGRGRGGEAPRRAQRQLLVQRAASSGWDVTQKFDSRF